MTLTAEERAELRTQHSIHVGFREQWCKWCIEEWPCAVSSLLADLDAAVAALATQRERAAVLAGLLPKFFDRCIQCHKPAEWNYYEWQDAEYYCNECLKQYHPDANEKYLSELYLQQNAMELLDAYRAATTPAAAQEQEG